MRDTIATVVRLRRHRRLEAQREFAQAEQQRLNAAKALYTVNQELHDTRHQGDATNAADVSSRHIHSIRLEMDRRRQETKMREADRKALVRQRAMSAAAKAHKVMELVSDARVATARREAMKKQQTRLDRVGLQNWWGKRR